MKKTLTVCDVCHSSEQERKMTEVKSLSVIFHTEQTEGRTVAPYLENHDLDLCSECLRKIMGDKQMLEANGAQGHNSYYFADLSPRE